ncbi:ketoacyl-synt-domain-containing protein [Aaosphaeria arxii CBS 175.79]|uniref:Ketoacyl-synt-domain-containing protein n=1 Tax=Aaosphaeria arxii CBS 175.79 TaxID=1450172 RepID=A0A6A5XMX7_9PLEO|nr:ketoacyl-synt-domain-containing protein [Aaosphaeria arxii CBS 175.79]KAF2014161.1 ketoacyl-synt-domain-containing protein [Aaosphaeria arxii CBS 175.79]
MFDLGDPHLPKPVAIIGTACRLPGKASSLSKLWELLLHPRDLLKEIPQDRFQWKGFYRPDSLLSTSKSIKGYFLEENIRNFDPTFFNIAPSEAENIDPQQRLLLENVYEAIESAGLTLKQLQGSDTGVFVGAMSNEYFDNANVDVDGANGTLLTTGTSRSIASNRISYVFDFKGPSMTIDTACSSSLVAVHLAVSALRQGECKVAFACGAHLNLSPNEWIALSKMNMISSDGRSKHLDATANGYGRGEGTSVVCLKLLEDAVKDGDHIECVIRQTGINQDGRTKGITMPSAEAQADLIRRTYNSVGLDPTKLDHRPSFFEAHGTGTPAGDPVEAQAVQDAFFPPGQNYNDEVLHIGSIKTIIGHTEGTAGVAGLLRASLAVSHGILPPSLHMSNLNPAVAPFSNNLRTISRAKSWPAIPAVTPRRVSVNSFGFGGTNVHAIVESYDKHSKIDLALKLPATNTLPLLSPFVFSAVSKAALASVMKSLSHYIRSVKHHSQFRDLASTLQQHRTQFSVRHTMSASNFEELSIKLAQALASHKAENDLESSKFTVGSDVKPRLMGIFTGQGSAQYSSMAKSLIKKSSYARKIISSLDESLASLPEDDRPDWSLMGEMTVDDDKSRMDEALIAQPVTTAVQILLVDLLASADVKLDMVVGHSSGEIAAAYSAGLITARDAIRIAYYRGLHSSLSSGNGAMLSTFLNFQDAIKFCAREEFRDRIVLAASNGPSMTTLSGDAETIDRASITLGQENVVARKLKVDKAYHSHHMNEIADGYMESIRLNTAKSALPVSGGTSWYSSVFPGRGADVLQELDHDYWVQNLKSPVLFSEAVSGVMDVTHKPDIFLEIGPHPVFERAVAKILEGTDTKEYHYIGLLKRGHDSVETMSDALGSIWTLFGHGAVNLGNYEHKLNPEHPQPNFIFNLPNYPWQHNKEYWWDNRLLRHRHGQSRRPLELLGKEASLGAQHEVKYRCFASPKDITWLSGHRVNGTIILPGASYVSMVMTAATQIFLANNIEMIEVKDLQLQNAISFPEEDAAVEIILTMFKINFNSRSGRAEFVVDFCSDQGQGELSTAVRGELIVRFGEDVSKEGQRRPPTQSHRLVSIDPVDFYNSIARDGYGFTDSFRSITSLQRRRDFATGVVTTGLSELLFHPALLDGLFQGGLAADSYPEDSIVSNLRVPASIKSVKVFTNRLKEGQIQEYGFDTKKNNNEYSGSLYDRSSQFTVISVQGLIAAPFTVETPEKDIKMFAEEIWKHDLSVQQLLSRPIPSNEHLIRPVLVAERLALYYLRNLCESISVQEEANAAPHLKKLLRCARRIVVDTGLGLLPHLDKRFLEDTELTIASLLQQFGDFVGVELTDRIGKVYPSIIRGEEEAINVLTKENGLTRLFRQGFGLGESNIALSQFIAAKTDMMPNMRILEVGAGTGAVSELILKSSTYASYTYTDISPAFLGIAKEKFHGYSEKVNYQVYDVDEDPEVQGFTPDSYEMIIASNVLHASSNLDNTLSHLRKLLRPGGYLVLMELSPNEIIVNTVLMGGFTGWWHHENTYRPWAPVFTRSQWDLGFKSSGFSGIDGFTQAENDLTNGYCIMVTQAIDDRVKALREPLSTLPPPQEDLLIIGGCPDLTNALDRLLYPYFRSVIHVASLEDILELSCIPQVVLCLLELDRPIFQCLKQKTWEALRTLFLRSTNVLWADARGRNPASLCECLLNMTIGLLRTVRCEISTLRLQHLSVDQADYPQLAEVIGGALIRWYLLGQFAEQGWQDDVLFPHHTEMVLEQGQILLPRTVHSQAPNDRFNSQHQLVMSDVTLDDSAIEVRFQQSGLIHEVYRALPQSWEAGHQVGIVYSSLHAIKIKKTGYFFVSVGVWNNDLVLVLSTSLASTVVVKQNMIRFSGSLRRAPNTYLHMLVSNLIVQNVMASARSKGALVILTSDSAFAVTIRQMVEPYKKLTFVTTDSQVDIPDVVFASLNASTEDLRDLLPASTSTFINLSDFEDDVELFNRLGPMFEREGVKIKSFEEFYKPVSSDYNENGQRLRTTLQTVIEACDNNIHHQENIYDPKHLMLTVDELSGARKRGFSMLVDWTAPANIAVKVRPLGSTVNLSPEKTYIIIGSSELCQSLAEWMVMQGARTVILGSRNPVGLDAWVTHMRSSTGARICPMSVDVTKVLSVIKLAAMTKSASDGGSFPPVGGIVHMGLVLKDAAFEKMSYEELTAVTDVKARGSLHLHEAFKEEKLDFFILTSSISYTTGNPGQANYNCGNGFMVGLAKYRRSIGLPASVVDLGHVSGLGYITRTREGTAYKFSNEDLRLRGGYPVSERDVYQIYAEVILASPADSGIPVEIITGVREIEHDMMDRFIAAKEPRFAHLRVHKQISHSKKHEQQLSLREQIQAAHGTPSDDLQDTIAKIVHAGFVNRLSVLLHMSKEEIPENRSLLEVGIDSLVATEVGSWARKELKVQVPSSMIFGGSSLLDLVKYATDHLDEEWIMGRENVE